MDKISKGKSNFENVLASQNCVFRKSGLGFNPQSKNNGILKPFQPLQKINRLKSRYNLLFFEKSINLLKILGKGTVGNENSFVIHDVFYVKGLKHNLLSIS